MFQTCLPLRTNFYQEFFNSRGRYFRGVRATLQSELKGSILARENQRENSKVSIARGRTIYKLLCDKVEQHGPHAEVRS
jgi:hypothetical protein